ncbi:MAG: adenosylcobinamide-GDP ribazoletransferase [Pyrobaculum sp.]
MWGCLKPLFGFFTVFPAPARLDFTCVWALPYVVAPVVAAPAAALIHLGVSPYVAYAVLLLTTGLHHLDGLADVADALMVRDRERARAVLEDPRKGTGGVFAVVVSFLVASSSVHAPLQLVAAEVFSKAITVVAAAFSRPFKPGLGEAFIYASRRKWPLVVPALAVTVWLSPMSLVAAVLAILFFYVAYRHLGGANGDVFGYMLELSRMSYLWLSF